MASTCPPLQFIERDADGLGSDSSFWELYGASFERRLREPARALIEAVRAGNVIVLVAEDEGRTVGFAVVHLLRDPAISLLTYLAVAPELRGQRIATTLLEQVVAVAGARHLAAGRKPRGWAVQLELPELAPNEAECDRRRRLQIYLRSRGARTLPCSSARPPVQGGTPDAARLVHAADGGLPLKRADVQALIHAIYFEKYGAANGVDRRVLEALLGPTPPGVPAGMLPGPGGPPVSGAW
jgi:GNAT superfamily N-acetyltransferase